jgi:NADPH:quinone reductase-like Zn-dependent oxidoreductase
MKAMAMRSWAKDAPVEPVELPDPTPKGHELRVRVKACGVNPVDWKMRSFGPLRLAARVIGPPAPVVVGIDFVGIVDAVGHDVSAFKVGDRVAGGTMFSRGQRGSMADTVCVRDDQVVHAPASVSNDVAGCLGVVGATAKVSLVDVGRLPRGGRVLVLGASGGVGQLVVGLAKRAHEATVVGVCSARNAPLVQGLGADHVIDYGAGDPLAAAAAFAPFDVVVDCAGGYDGAACRRLLKSGGRHCIVAGDGPGAAAQPFMPPFSSKMILGMPLSQNLQPVMDLLASGAVSIAIAERIPLAELERAHALSRTGRLTGKLVMIP